MVLSKNKFAKNKSAFASAFTLIELLVVIAIIGILATISVIALNNARARARDARRVADVKQVQTALELFYNDKGRYPTITEWNSGSIYSTSTIGTTTYMQIIPSAPAVVDGSCPSLANHYIYNSLDGSTYSLSYCLGGSTGSLMAGRNCATQSGISGGTCFICGLDQLVVSNIAGYACNPASPNYDTCAYDTVPIGSGTSTQCWLKQNFNVGNIVPGTSGQSSNGSLEKFCMNGSHANCQSQGGLYQWGEAMQYSIAEGAQGICPTGWHIPTDAEQDVLDQYLKDSGQTCSSTRNSLFDCATAGYKLKAVTLWGGMDSASNNSSRFSAVPAGFVDSAGASNDQGIRDYIWSSSISGSYAWDRNFISGNGGINRVQGYQTYGYSVRCLQNQ